ncbi:transmembrane protein 135-like [Galendromus occidentalis]|uniref:Transmembrane protein 135-like n=1 Tax=Galendromus occidentalis TaxID=34638 RepID=A0AAJ6QZ49_9ACAR|nr:transmembrane protein 135-like [Galendromus occidentalis]
MSVLSKFRTIPYNCYEIAHPTVESCADLSLNALTAAFRRSITLYGTIFIIQRVISGRFGWADILRTIPKALQSSMFVTVNIYLFISLTCQQSRILKKFSLMTPLNSALLSSLLAIHLEVPARRRLLAVYMMDIATETAYESMCLHTNFKPIPYFPVFLYAASMAAHFHRATSSRDLLVRGLGFLIGQRSDHSIDSQPAVETQAAPGLWASLKARLSPSSHDCTSNSCVHHAARSGIRGLVSGYLLSVIISLPGLLRGSSPNKESAIRLGAFLAVTSAGTSGIQCLLQKSSLCRTSLSAKTRLTIAVFVSSLSIAIYPSRRIALHIFWRTLASYLKFDSVPYPLPEATYAICCAALAFFVVYEPQTLRKSYLKSLDQLSGDCLSKINRHPLEAYSGCHSSKLYPEFFPMKELKLSRVSPKFIEQVLIWSVR